MHARRIALIFLTNGIGALAGLVALFFVGRFMTPAAYGAFGFAMSLMGIWLVLADLAMERAHARHVGAGYPLGDCIRTLGVVKLGLLVVMMAGLVLTALLWSESGRFHDATGSWVLFAVAVYVCAVMIRSIPAANLNALGRTAGTQVAVLVEHLVKLPLVVCAALFFGHMTDEDLPVGGLADEIAAHTPFHRPMTPDEGGLLLAVAWALALLVSATVALVTFWRQSLPAGRYVPRLAASYWAFALPVSLVASIRLLSANVDALFIGWFLSAANVGYYAAADRLSMLAYMVPLALQTVFFPLFARLAAGREIAVLAGLAQTLQRVISLFMMLLAAFFVLFATAAVPIVLGDAFLPAADVLPWLAVSVLLLSLTMVPTNVVVTLDSPFRAARYGALAFGLNLVLDAWFVPDLFFGVRVLGFHAAGAAAATAISQLLLFVLMERAARRLLGRPTLGRAVGKHVVAVLTTGLALVLMAPMILGATPRVWELAFVGLVGAALYVGQLVLMRELSRADLALLHDAMRPSHMLAYIRDDLRDRRRADEVHRKT